MSEQRVHITKLVDRHDTSSCKAVASVLIGCAGIEVNGVMIIERQDGSIFVKVHDIRDHHGNFSPSVRFADQTILDEIKHVVESRYYASWTK